MHTMNLDVENTLALDSPNVLGPPLIPRTHRTVFPESVRGTRTEPSAKIPGEFRTLSIHVTDTRDGRTDSAPNKDVTELSKLQWHILDILEICTRLGVSEKSGLDAPMAARRLATNGKNIISPPPKNYLKKLFFYVFGGFGSLLFVASIVCFIAWRPLGDPNPSVANLALAVVLLIVILIQATFNAWQDFTTGRTMSSISDMVPTSILVTRDGETFKLPAADLVLGDIVTITLGSKVPADCRLIDVSSDLQFDRSILTGESEPIAASVDCTNDNVMESRNIALQGTLCISGSGRGICVGLGDGTVFGRIAKQASSERPQRTTLEVEILRVVMIIASLALFVATIIVILWAAWLRRSHPDFISVPVLLIDVVSVAVAFIPEGLPICVTLSLTVIARAMRRANVLCKSLSTVETLGAVNILASDKTGTLTQNKMTVVRVTIGSVSLSAAEARDQIISHGSNVEVLDAVTAVAGLCNDASFEISQDQLPSDIRKVHGDATDEGLLRFSDGIKPVSSTRDAWKEVAKLSFNSKNKFALKLFKPSVKDQVLAPLTQHDDFDGSDLLLLVKGAPDILYRRCSHLLDSTGATIALDSTALLELSAIQEDIAAQGNRVLLLAKRVVHSKLLNEVDTVQQIFTEDDMLNLAVDLTIIGLVALIDPPRHDIPETVRVCRRAGIRFAMVTGDFSLTAVAIARQVGIITTATSELRSSSDLDSSLSVADIAPYNADKGEHDKITSLVLSGHELMTLNESQWKQALAFDEIVFARTSPQQKFQIVRELQKAGCTVAVTGDGVNDAPALKQANVGVAIAGGSAVAMEAADLILLSDFSAIIVAIQYGRLCFENLRKSILYLLPAGSFAELMPVLLNILTGVPQALSSIQMILICVVTDVLPALSMVYEKPESDLLLRKPRDPKKDRLVDWKLLLHAYFFLGILESLTAMTGAFYFGFQRNGIPFSALWLKYGDYGVDAAVLAEATNKAQSMYFFNLVLMQWFNLLATRTRRLSIFQQNPFGPQTRNLYIFPAMAIALMLACFFSYISIFQDIFLSRGVSVEYFFLPMAYGVVLLFADEARKWSNRAHPNSLLAKIAW
ncbi:hypothetical protein C8J56DRAFT_213171 [Mycena floridula]|nr:hypothetical protein C8J56DRAFT_213171 [Mycena floridula]